MEYFQKISSIKTNDMKKFIFSCAVAFFALLTVSSTSYAQYAGAMLEINSQTGVYAVGDSIKVWANVYEGCAPVLDFKIEKNMISEIRREEVRLEVGRHLMYEDVCNEAAHYVFMLGLEGERPGTDKVSVVGAIVSPESFQPGYKAPADLAEFWEKQIEQMRKMPLTCEAKPAPVEKDDQTGYKCLDIEIPMPEGNPVRAYLVHPENAAPKSLPIVIRAHSAGVKGKWCQSSVDMTIQDAKRGGGAIALDINAHGMLNGQPQSYYDDLDAGELYKYSTRDFTGHEDFYFRLMYLRLVRALDYLVTLPQWDGERVAVYGESQGGAQTAALAGMDSRVTACVLRVPAFIDIAGRFMGRKGSWPGTYGRQAKERADVLSYYDGACLLTLTKAKLFFEAGLVDYTCPPGCVVAGYNVAPSDDKTIVFFPYRPHTTGKMDKRAAQRWRTEIMTPREKWLDDYLK